MHCACGRKLPAHTEHSSAYTREDQIVQRLDIIRRRRIRLVADALPATYEHVVATLRELNDEVEALRRELGDLRRQRSRQP